MKKRMVAIICCLVALFFCACSGFNNVMYDHLSEVDHYQTYSVTVVHQYFDGDMMILEVIFDNYEDVKHFLGAEPNQDIPLDLYCFRMRIIADNCSILAENGFHDEIVMNDVLEIFASSYIYMDTEFFYIAGVTHEDKVYLPAEQGIKNIIAYMKKNRSLF